LGGTGYIFGLMGIVMYFKARGIQENKTGKNQVKGK